MALGVLTALKRTFLLGKVDPSVHSDPPVPEKMCKLSRTLLAHGNLGTNDKWASFYDAEAWCAPDHNAVKLFIHEVGISKLLFHTPTPLQKGQTLDLEMLLQGLGNWRGQASVDWCLATTGGFSGQVSLQCEPEQHQLWTLFVNRQLKGERS